jgi:PhnB protein
MSDASGKPSDKTWLSPFVTVRDVRAAAAFYEAAFGFRPLFVLTDASGRAAHAEVEWRGSAVLIGLEDDLHHGRLPRPETGTTVTMYVYCDVVDEIFERAVAAGAGVVEPVRQRPWGDRTCVLSDPDGHLWMFATHVEGIDPEAVHLGE